MISYPDKIYFFLAGKPNGGLKLFIRIISSVNLFSGISNLNHLEMKTHTGLEIKTIIP
jgi:hypothetical protein